MWVSRYNSIGQSWPLCFSFPSYYLGHSRIQVVHDHVHDSCCGFRPARVLLHWVGPARRVQPLGMIMGGHTGVNSETKHPAAEVTWELPAGTKANWLCCSPYALCPPPIQVWAVQPPLHPRPPFLPSQQAPTEECWLWNKADVYFPEAFILGAGYSFLHTTCAPGHQF